MRALLIDTTECIGCGSCSSACREKNNLPEIESTELNDKQFTILKTVSTRRGDVNYRRLCMHCADPACASVCPVGALQKTANGPVLYDEAKCIGCRYCVQACAFGIPKYEWSSLKPRVRKCVFCADRLAEGKVNACAEACPTGATLAGDREALLREARARLAAEPDKYIQKIYGEHDAGGTSVLFLSSVPFEAFGLPPNLPAEPLPLLTFRVLRQIPSIVTAGSCVLAGLWWFTGRKNEVARKEGAQACKVRA